MTLVDILHDNLLLQILCIFLILEGQQNKPEPSSSLRLFISHHNCVVNASENAKVFDQVLLGCLESKSTHK